MALKSLCAALLLLPSVSATLKSCIVSSAVDIKLKSVCKDFDHVTSLSAARNSKAHFQVIIEGDDDVSADAAVSVLSDDQWTSTAYQVGFVYANTTTRYSPSGQEGGVKKRKSPIM